MNNNERLETILKIREKRKDFDNLNLSSEEKEVLKRALNYYEHELDLEIARMNNEIIELENMEIQSNNKQVIVPSDNDDSKYKEYADIYKIDINSIVNSLYNKLDDSIMLKSLKEYCLSLQELNNIKKNNQEEFKEYLSK